MLLITKEVIGHSLRGKPITMESYNSHRTIPLGEPGALRVFLYALPHPDEPMGLLTIKKLINSDKLPEAHWYIVSNPDPDLESYNERWTKAVLSGRAQLDDFIYGSFRPEHLAHELDYYFPADWENFRIPEYMEGNHVCIEGLCNHTLEGDHEQFPGVLPESRALALAWKKVRPDIVVALHDTHSGGIYHFLNKRPDKDLLEGLGLKEKDRHLGEPIDGGRRWDRKHPEAIREPTLEEYRKRIIKNNRDYDPKQHYYLPVSAAMWLEHNLPDAVFMVPEAGHFSHDYYGMTKKTDVIIGVEREPHKTKAGKEIIREYIKLVHLDMSEEKVYAGAYDVGEKDPNGKLIKPTKGKVVMTPLTRGHLAVMAVMTRRKAYQQIETLFAKHQSKFGADSLWVRNQMRMSSPARYIYQKQLLWYRKDPRYHKAATWAHYADFQWRWNIHTMARMGYLVNELERIGETKDAKEVRDMIDKMKNALPPELDTALGSDKGAESQLKRIFVLVNKWKTTLNG